MSIRQSDGTFDGKNIVLWATALEPDRPGRKTVSRAHLEDDGRLLQAYFRRVKHLDGPPGEILAVAVDQSFHITTLLLVALLAEAIA